MKYVLGDRAADWLRRQLAAGYTSGPAPARQRARDASTPLPDLLPYTVRWCSAEASGDGAWVVWLGDLSRVLYHAGVARQPGGVTAAATLPAGWYLVDDFTASGTALWLNVRMVSGTGAFDGAELSSTPGSATSGYDVAAYCVAVLSVDATTGARAVVQYICSAVVLAAAGSGGGGGGTSGYTGTQYVPYDFDGPRSDGKLYALTRTWTFADGLLQSVTTGPDVVVADTVEHSGL